MTSTPIDATDEITIPFPATEVWPVLADFAVYSRWWPKSLEIRILSGGMLLGTEVEIRPAGGRSFRCRVEAVDEPRRIQMRYFGGFIEGFGEWRLEPLGQETRVIYKLEAKAHGWMAVLLGKVLNLGQIHSRSMQLVLQNLSQELDRNRHDAEYGQNASPVSLDVKPDIDLRSPIVNTKIHSITALDAAPRTMPSSYPEPFRSMMNGRVKRPLGDLFGLTNFGVNITVLAPGAMSALHHAHSKQDEFIYVVSGTLALYIDEGRTELHAGMCAGFKAGTGNAHHLVNETSVDAVYLEAGDRMPGDEVTYPDDDLVARFADGSWHFFHKDGRPYP